MHALVEYDGAAGIAEGSMRMPGSYPFSSNIRVLAERGVAEYAFSATPVEGEGNIGASSSARGLRVYPAGGEMRTERVEPADPWGPEIAYFVSCLEQKPTAGGGHGRPGAGRTTRVVGREPLARERPARAGLTSQGLRCEADPGAPTTESFPHRRRPRTAMVPARPPSPGEFRGRAVGTQADRLCV